MWAQGQRSLAMRLAWALLGSPAPVDKLQRSRLQSLLGKWLSLNRWLADWYPSLQVLRGVSVMGASQGLAMPCTQTLLHHQRLHLATTRLVMAPHNLALCQHTETAGVQIA